MGLDVGDKRIGVAMSDEDSVIASPRETLERRGNRKDIARLIELATEQKVGGILVGMPFSLDGSVGPQAKKVERFVAALRNETQIPVTLWDERLTTASAERALLEGGVRRAERRQTVDRVAAAIILQSYLDARRQPSSEN